MTIKYRNFNTDPARLILIGQLGDVELASFSEAELAARLRVIRKTLRERARQDAANVTAKQAPAKKKADHLGPV